MPATVFGREGKVATFLPAGANRDPGDLIDDLRRADSQSGVDILRISMYQLCHIHYGENLCGIETVKRDDLQKNVAEVRVAGELIEQPLSARSMTSFSLSNLSRAAVTRSTVGLRSTVFIAIHPSLHIIRVSRSARVPGLGLHLCLGRVCSP